MILFATALVTGAGCKDQNNPAGGDSPSDVVFPTRDVQYNAQVQVLFNQACNYDGCHGEGVHQSPLKLTTWANTVVMTAGVVVPGNPDASTLVLRVEGRGPRMPPSGNPLNQNQIDGLRTWIAEGAKNN
jgi:mono/diheme cytochrome c family protein